MSARSGRFRDQAADYQAVFRKDDDIYDLRNVHFLVQAPADPYELEYELWTSDGRRPTSGMLLEYTTLPISEEEFRRLSASHPDERGTDDPSR